MPPDSYKIEVLHFLNPHLIWIEVHDPSVIKDEFLFEQVGLYGVLPLEKTLDIQTEALRSQTCEQWLPAAASVMKAVLEKSTEIWFSPTYIDRRTSIFDDNIHKFGELTIITEGGKKKKLSKQLIKSGFAYYDVCNFHEKLSSGKLKTKLSSIRTQEVVKELENFYIKKDKPKNWKKSVEKQTSVFQLSQDFESSLTVSNLEKHNNEMICKTLQNKFKDFELCKDVDELSLGRAYGKTNHRSNDYSRPKFLQKKLSNAQEVSTKTSDLKTAYDDIKTYLDVKSNVQDSNSCCINEFKRISGNSYSKIDGIKTDNKKKILTTQLKQLKSESVASESVHEISFRETHSISKMEQNKQARGVTPHKPKFSGGNAPQEDEGGLFNTSVNHLNQTKVMESDMSTPKNFRTVPTEGSYEFVQQKSTSSDKKRCDSSISNTNYKKKQYRRPIKSIKMHESDRTAKYACGPPEMNPEKFVIRNITVEDCQDTSEKICTEEELVFQKNKSTFSTSTSTGKVDSDVGIEIVNKNILNDYLKKAKTVSKEKTIQKDDIITTGEEINLSDNSTGKITSSSFSLLLNRKLKVYHNISLKHNSSVSGSDTSNKDSSSDPILSNNSCVDHDNMEHVMERLKIQYKDDLKDKEDDRPPDRSLIVTKLKNNVNPFKNIDPNISVFVDKLVTPVLMVHSKHDRHIQPVFEMRDIYFNNHIHNVLKHMSVEQPMTLQTVSWFTILRGYSLFMISPMDSGKTLGYLPAVCRMVGDCNSVAVDSVGPICIIVCATAQSVASVERMAKMFLETRNRILACYAGVDNLHITTTLLNGCDLLICTPSSLVRLLQVTDFGVDLRRLATFVLDDCEGLADVYADEIKFFLHKIRGMLKTRANTNLKVQYILASRTWCDFMEPLAKRVPDTVICIGAFQECVLYSKTNTSMSIVKSENKVDSVFEFLKDVNASSKTVIVCQTNEEVELLEGALKRSKRVVFACDNNMTIHDLYNLSVTWIDYEEPVMGPILICCDSNLMHMNITDAHCLIHYSLPPLYSLFCKRFSVLNDNYPSIFKTDNESVKIKVLLEESNLEQLPKILNFMRRCTNNVPEFLDEISSNVLAMKDAIKAKNLYPICDRLLTLGYCPDFYNCQDRHTILKEYDTPKEWLPKEGVITCKIIYFHSATLYSARLLSCVANDAITNYPQTYSKISLKMGIYYSKENKKLHGIPKVGDICATSIKLNFYVRCQVLKILSKYQRGNPNEVWVKLIDEERYEVTRDIYLYYLPEDLKAIESRVVQVRLGNVGPKDKDKTFSDLARDHVKNMIEADDELLVKGNISLTIGNCIFVNTLEACQDLTSLNEVFVKYNLKRELLENHAMPNSDHLPKLEKLCIEGGLLPKRAIKLQEPKMPIKNLPRGTWAHLDSDSMTCVFFASAITPDKFFVRLNKFESCMNSLLQDIQKYVDANPECGNVKEGDIVLARFPDDSTYERARIDGINDEKAKCFFVDQGDWREVPLNHLLPITEQFINRLPFQAIECRLIGINPVGVQWTDFSTYWFSDNCHNNNGDLKHLFVKYFTKEPAEFTNGHKYSVAVIDTSTDQDVVLNQLMIDLNLAQENDSEIKYLDNLEINTKEEEHPQSSSTVDDGWETISSIDCHKDELVNITEAINVPSQNSRLLKPPIRSIPLVNSDDDSDDYDKWDAYVDDNFKSVCFEVFKGLKHDNPQENITTSPETSHRPSESEKRAEIIELDSDDLTSSDDTLPSTVSPEKPQLIEIIDQRRRPKLVWRQNKHTVTVKIQLLGIDDYKLDIEDRQLNFSANVNDSEYGFELELYGVIDKAKCVHVNKGQYVLVKLSKVLGNNWLTLTTDGGMKKWIVYDVDSLDTSSEEEVVDEFSMKNVVRNIHNKVDSESDDDEFVDDVNGAYKIYD